MKPVVLIATTTRWVPTARLAMALVEAGFGVEAICPAGHPITLTDAAKRTYNFSGLRPMHSLALAIAASKPDLIIPGDDLATLHLHALHRLESRRKKTGTEVSALIERSLGAPAGFSIVSARAAFMCVAKEQGICCPETEVIATPHDFRSFNGTGFPLVLKADGSSGGEGVRIVQNREDAERALRVLDAPPMLARALKRLLLDRDSTLVWPSLFRRRSVVNVQAYAGGLEATSAVACWKGRVLASMEFEVVTKTRSTGHATVLRPFENEDMSNAAKCMASRLCLSGLHGFDFMIDTETNNAQLIEINPRSTQIGHLSLGPGRDLAAALYAALSGEPVKPAPKVTEKEVIVLFPNEWLRDSESRFLRSGHHDVPWQAPRLIRACILKSGKRHAWYSPRASPKVLQKQIDLGD